MAVLANETTCVSTSDPCVQLDCGLGGTCLNIDGSGICMCYSGYAVNFTSGACIPETLQQCMLDCLLPASCFNDTGVELCECPNGMPYMANASMPCGAVCPLQCNGAGFCDDEGECHCNTGFRADVYLGCARAYAWFVVCALTPVCVCSAMHTRVL
jgi:hypothetical protein